MTDFDTLAGNVDTTLDHEHVDVGDVTLHVVTAGPADGDVVLCLHGFPEFWYSWREQLPALADAGYHVIVPDMRGYNESDKPSGVSSYSVDRLSRDVVDLIEHYSIDNAASTDSTGHVVGHDWGGGVAYDAAIRHPDSVRTLTVMNAPHPGRFHELLRRPAQLRRSWYMFSFQLPHLPEYALTRNDAALLDDVFEDSIPPDEIRHYRDAIQRPGAATAMINYYRAMGRNALHNALPLLDTPTSTLDDHTITAPTRLIWGDQDDALIPANTTNLHEWIPDLTVDHIPDATHWVQLDAPQRVTDTLLEHLEQ